MYILSILLKSCLIALSPSEVGLLLSTVFILTSFQSGILLSTETENHMSSVQRVIEYGQLPSEASLESAKGTSHF